MIYKRQSLVAGILRVSDRYCGCHNTYAVVTKSATSLSITQCVSY